MSSEIDLYRGNVPHGDGDFETADWTSSQSTVTITAGTSTEIFVNTVRFIAASAFAISAGNIVIAGGGRSHQIDSPFELYGMSDPFILKNQVLAASDQYIIGEIKFNPPLVIDSGEALTITPSTAPALSMSGALYWTIEYWEDAPATA
jgi:hypothetical protein